MLSKISAWYRVAIICSILWVIGALIITDPWIRVGGSSFSSFGNSFSSSNNWNEFIYVGILPVLFFWGGLWIINGFKDKVSTQEKNKLKKKIFGRAKRELTPEIRDRLIRSYHVAKSKGLDPYDAIRDSVKDKKTAELFDRFFREEIAEYKNDNPDPLKIENNQSNISEEKTICPICSSFVKKVHGKTDSDGISYCYDCYAKRFNQQACENNNKSLFFRFSLLFLSMLSLHYPRGYDVDKNNKFLKNWIKNKFF